MGPESVIPALNNTRLQDIISSASLDLFIRTQQLTASQHDSFWYCKKGFFLSILGLELMKIRAVVSPVCVSGQLPLPRARVISVTGTWQCVVCNAGNVMCNVKWLLDPFNRGPWDQGWAACCALIGGVLAALSSDWLIHWPHIRHPGEVRAANTCQQKSALTPLQYNKLRTNENDKDFHYF